MDGQPRARSSRGGKVVYCCNGAKGAPEDAAVSTSGDAVIERIRDLFPTPSAK